MTEARPYQPLDALRCIRDDVTLGASATLVSMVLVSLADNGTQTWIGSYGQWAMAAKMNRRTLIRIAAELAQPRDGFTIEITKSFDVSAGKNRPSAYRIIRWWCGDRGSLVSHDHHPPSDLGSPPLVIEDHPPSDLGSPTTALVLPSTTERGVARPPEAPQSGKKPKRRKPETAMPDGWEPTAAHRQLASELGVEIGTAATEFREWTARDDRRYRDWDAAFSGSLRRQSKWDRSDAGGGSPTPKYETADTTRADPGVAKAGAAAMVAALRTARASS